MSPCRLTRFNGSILIGKTWSEHVVFSGVRQISISAGAIVVAMRTIPLLLRKAEFTKVIEKILHGSRPMNLMN